MNELQLLKSSVTDDLWLQKHLDTIRKKNEGKFVAIKNEKIIAADKDLEKVILKIQKVGENPSFVVIEFIHKKGYNLIL